MALHPSSAARSVSRSSRASSAQSRLEYYLRAESRLSQVSKPDPEEDESRGQYAWRLIRHCVRDAIDLTMKADGKELTVTHGIQASRKVPHAQTIQHMIYNKNTREFYTTDGKLLRIFHHDGRKKEVLEPEEPFNRILHAHMTDLYIGWTYNNPHILLMTSELEMTSSCNALGPILSMVYNENIGEVVTAGKGFLTSWVFRYGGRHLLPRKITQAGIEEHDSLEMLVLEQTASRSQRAFACNGEGIYVFNLHEGTVLEYKDDLHTRKVTAILFFNPLKYLITSAKDGCIKVWDEQWHLQLVFVGHYDAVTTLAIYPYGPNIMSASCDKTIRVWSLETCDEVDIIHTDETVRHIATLSSTDTFFSVSKQHADIWKVKHVHVLHTRVNQRVNLIKVTDHPEFPERGVLLCKDSSVRIVSPISGDVITTLIMPTSKGLIDAAYAIAEHAIFACFSNGDIIKAYTGTNPCTILEEWPCRDKTKICNYLLVYEYVISADVKSDMWGGFKRIAATKGMVGGTSRPGTQGSANRTLLLGGRKDGKICVFNMDTGDIEFEIEGHGSKGVLSMMANSKADQLISAGLDNIIKVWRLFPYAQESLAPLMSFYCAHTPIYMSVLRNKLAVAFQEPTSATYSIVMYNLEGKDRHDHGPEDDHMDNITGLSSCNKIKLLASCSSDGTIRIWNEVNNLLRIIKLNATPSSVAFCSEKGDLLVGIGVHVHRIDYKQYMPKAYRFRMVSMKMRDSIDEKALPYDDNLLNHLSKDDQRRLKNARSSFKFTHFMDVLTEAENEEVMREAKLREEAYAKLANRENELAKIRDGEVEAKKKPKPTKATRSAAFNKYLDMFYSLDKHELPQEEEFWKDRVKARMEGPKPPPKDEWIPEKEPTGFFPSAAQAKKPEKTPSRPLSPPLRPDGFIPNSVLIRLLWPKEVTQELSTTRGEYRPPKLTDAQLAQITGANSKRYTQEEKADVKSIIESLDSPDYRLISKNYKLVKSRKPKAQPKMTEQNLPNKMVRKLVRMKKFAQKGEDRTLVLDYSDEETEQKIDEEDEYIDDDELMKKPPAALGSIMNKVEEVIAKDPTPVASPEPVKPAEEETEKQPPKKIVMRKPIQKLIAPKPPSEPAPAPVVQERRVRARPKTPPPKTPSPPPRPPTPLPGFILMCKDEPWFQQYFPNLTENTLPKPWTVGKFVEMLVRILRIGDFDTKNHVTEALIQIHADEVIPNTDVVYKTMYSVLNHHTTPPSCQDPVQKEFISKAVQLLTAMGTYDRDYFMELLVQLMEADSDVRKQVLGVLKAVGLRDPQDFLMKELDSWDVWNLEEKERASELRNMTKQWLDKWLTSFKIHMADSIDRLKKGGTVMNKASASAGGKASAGKGILRKSEDDAKPADNRVVTVTFEKPPDESTIESATYMDAINYFCEMELEKSLDKLRKGDRDQAQKNTVLVLPKIAEKGALVRLGETHTSKCKPVRETSLAVDFKLPAITDRGRLPPPGQLCGFPPCINLPLKSVVMNPFLSTLEKAQLEEAPILLMLKSSQKYFIHERSVVPPPAAQEAQEQQVAPSAV